MNNKVSRHLNENIVCCESEGCSDLSGTVIQDNRIHGFSTIEIGRKMSNTETASASMMLLNNGYDVRVMEPVLSSHDPLKQYVFNTTNAYQDNMLVLTSTNVHGVACHQHIPITNHSIYYCFSSAFEVHT